jgi:uncharacterized protein YkwD
MKVSRRNFLQSTTASLGFALMDRKSLAALPHDDLENIFAEIRANLLAMINEERAVEKASKLAMDELATQVAQKHAVDMANGGFASHWGRDGLKPYQRYSFADGIHATQENVSAADNTWSTKLEDLKQDTAYLHVRLYEEKPPNDGHRRTILAPQHTHVGFGIAVEELRLRMVELFVAKYVDLRRIPRTAKPGSQIIFSGTVQKRDYGLSLVEVFYEPIPKPPELSWLREPRSYALPKESRVFRPKATTPFIAGDKSPSIVELPSSQRNFDIPIRLFKDEPGIYTLVAWLRGDKSRKLFPATEVCIRAE